MSTGILTTCCHCNSIGGKVQYRRGTSTVVKGDQVLKKASCALSLLRQGDEVFEEKGHGFAFW